MIYIIFSRQCFPAFDIKKTNKETSAVAYEKLKDIYTFLSTDTTLNPIILNIKFYIQDSLKIFREHFQKLKFI